MLAILTGGVSDEELVLEDSVAKGENELQGLEGDDGGEIEKRIW